MSDETTRRDLLLAGVVVTAAGAASARGAEPARFRIALTGDFENLAAKAAPWTTLGPDVEVVSFNKPLTAPSETTAALRDFDAIVLMRERTPLPREVIQNLPRLKFVLFSGSLPANFDYAAANERKIVVAAAGGGDDEDTPAGGGGPAELTMALLMACAWHVPQADAMIRGGGWAMQPAIPLKIPLAGRVLGIPGYGAIGTRVGRYAKAFGMEVLGFSRSLTDDEARKEGVTRADLETVMRNSDVVSVHLPLTAQTRGMIGAKELDLMKPGVVFLNTARGPIVDEAALVQGLRSRRIAMAGIDVYDTEPLPRSHPFNQLPNVVMTPHIGYVSEGGMTSRYQALFQVMTDYRRGAVKPYTPTVRT